MPQMANSIFRFILEQENATSMFHSLRENGVLVVLNTGCQEDTAKGLISSGQGYLTDLLIIVTVT